MINQPFFQPLNNRKLQYCMYLCTRFGKSRPLQDQLQSPAKLMSDAYKNTPEWGKYKTLRTIGWTTFGVGIAATTTGVLLLLTSNSDLGSDAMSTASKAAMISGAAITAASVPILCVAYHNRNKAKKINMSMGVTRLQAPTLARNLSSTPAINFTITF